MLCAIDRSAPSVDRAALSTDPLLAQPSKDRAAQSMRLGQAGLICMGQSEYFIVTVCAG